MADVALNGVSKRFNHIDAVHGLDLKIADGEFVVLLGPTGAGKTTTLRLIAGLERPDAGEIWIDHREATREPPSMRNVAFVFQQYSLYPHLTVFDNLAFPLRSPACRTAEPEIRKRVEAVASLLHIEGKLRNMATRLSGGEMQRVAIGRALVRSPSIFLMDEPLSSLDAKLRAELRLELKRIQAEMGATILYVTHDQIEAMTMATRIGVIHDGRLLQVGTPRDIYEQPDTIYVAGRLGAPAINLLPLSALPSSTAPASARTLGARTEQLRLSKPNGHGPIATVRRVEHLGDQSHVHLTLGEHSLVLLADPHQPVSAGDHYAIEAVDPLYFDSEGRRIVPNMGGAQ